MERGFDISGNGFSRWVGIIDPNAVAPERGVYLIARVGIGQGFDIEYEVRVLDKGESLDDINHSQWTSPIAFHYVPEESPDEWAGYIMLYPDENRATLEYSFRDALF